MADTQSPTISLAGVSTADSLLAFVSQHLTALMRTPEFTLSDLASAVISVSKEVTRSLWAEFLYVEGEDLVVCCTKEGRQSEVLQSLTRLPISEESAPGYVVIRRKPLVINHANSSRQYEEFKHKFASFSAGSVAESPQHLLCLPIYANTDKPFGVLHLFDKADSNGFLSPYTEEDISLLTSISNLLSGILSMQGCQKRLRKFTEQLDYFTAQRHNLSHLSLQLIRKDSLMRLLKHLITDSQTVTYEYVDLMAEAMESQGVLLHLVSKEQVVCPWIAYGIEFNCEGKEEIKALCTRTSEYVAMDISGVLQVRDYTKEKHFNCQSLASWSRHFRTSLSLPIIQDGSLIGILEFYRLTEEFTSKDQHTARLITAMMQDIPPSGFHSHLPLSSTQHSSAPRIPLHSAPSILDRVREFSIRKEGSQFDFVRYGRQLRSSIRDLVRCESCGFFIRDAMTNTFWTWVSYTCDPLIMPISEYTLLGYSLLKRQIINEQFPCSNPTLNELIEPEFAPRCSLVVPVIGEVLKDQSLGVVILSRTEGKFTPEEISLVHKLLLVTAFTLESLFFSMTDPTPTPSQYYQPTSPSPPRMRKKERLSSLAPIIAPVREVDEAEYAQRVRRSRTWTDLPDEEDRYLHLGFLCQLAGISTVRLNEVKGWLSQIKEEPEETLSLLLLALPVLVPCQKAKLYLLHSSRMYLQDMETGSLYTPVGIIKEAFVTCKTINFNANIVKNCCDNLASMGIFTPIDTILAVPIAYLPEEVIGVLVFINATSSFTGEDQAIAEFLSLVPSHTVLTPDHRLKKWDDVLREGLKQEALLTWCKQIMGVSASCQQTASKLKDITQSVISTSDFPVVISALLEVICANMNVEDAAVVVRHNDGYLAAFTRSKGLQLLQSCEETERLKDFFSIGGSRSQENCFGKVNLLTVSIKADLEVIGCLQLWNKQDVYLSVHCSFTNEDLTIAQRYALKLAEPLSQWLANDSADTAQLRAMIHKTVATVQAYPLMSVIRKAALQLLDCDRSTIFMREGDQMVVYAQGIEQELPDGFALPIGVGIVGSVAQTRQPICLKDAYQDTRFSKQMDELTGYRTSSMLCIPVFDSNHEVIAALQMINKRRGEFNEEDMQILDIFRDVISSALQIFDRFKAIVGENTSLLNVLNNLQSYVFVLNKEGKINYCNQKFEHLFGYPEQVGRNRHFTFWMRENSDLIKDLQVVLASPDTKISREFQNLRQSQLRRTSALTSTADSTLETVSKVHYCVSALRDITTQEPVGLVLVIEDVTKLVEMNSDLKMMKIRLKELQENSAVKAETGLYRCITTLQQLKESLPSSSTADLTNALSSVLEILKSGDLEKTELYYAPSGVQTDEDLRVFIDREFLRRNSDSGHQLRLLGDLDIKQRCSSTLRNWDLNLWDLGDLFPHIVSMFSEFNFLSSLDIRSKVLLNFLVEMRRLYDTRHNPFHNFTHGVSVMHSMYFLLTSTKVQTWFFAEETFALLLAALCHDVDHTGRTNSFEVSKGSVLALRYHDLAVLEQHHAATTFFVMQQEACNILANCHKDVYLSIRKIVIAGILGTDMSKHFPMLLKMNLRFKDMHEAPIGSREHDKADMAELLVHCCDLGHTAKHFSLCSRWAQLLRQEHIAQSKEEITLGLAVTPFIKDLEDVRAFYKNEVSFTTVIVQPLWECVHAGLQPYTAPQLKALHTNIAAYRDLLSQALETTS